MKEYRFEAGWTTKFGQMVPELWPTRSSGPDIGNLADTIVRIFVMSLLRHSDRKLKFLLRIHNS